MTCDCSRCRANIENERLDKMMYKGDKEEKEFNQRWKSIWRNPENIQLAESVIAIQKEYSKVMTRKEAEAKLEVMKVPRDIHGRYFLIDVLEALDLITFTPEEKVKVIDITDDSKVEIRRYGFKVYSDGKNHQDKTEIIDALAKSGISYTLVEMELNRAGFEVVRK